MIYIPLLKYSI